MKNFKALVSTFCYFSRLDEAAQIAFEQRDIQGLLYVQSKSAPMSPLSDKINNYMSQLSTRKVTQTTHSLFT